MRPTAVVTAVSSLLLLAACSVTDPSPATVQKYKDQWLSHHFTKYAYDMETTGFNTTLSGDPSSRTSVASNG